MTTSNVANACSSLYVKAGMGNKSSSKRCSRTRIRHACATQLAGYDNEKLDVVAKAFMKNREGTTQKFYVQYWNQKEAIRLSMKMYERTRGEIQIDLPKPNPVSKEECIKWYEDNKKRVPLENRLDLNDRHLEKSMIEEIDERIDVFQTIVDEGVTDSEAENSKETAKKTCDIETGKEDEAKETAKKTCDIETGKEAKESDETEAKDDPIQSKKGEAVSEIPLINRYEVEDDAGKKYFYDLLDVQWMSRPNMASVEARLGKATMEDFSSSWASILPALKQITEGKVDSYRHDVYNRLKVHKRTKPVLENGKYIEKVDHELKPHHLQWPRKACIKDDVLNHLSTLVKEAFGQDPFQYKLDVLEPAAWKFFVIDFCSIESDEVEYFIDNFDKDWLEMLENTEKPVTETSYHGLDKKSSLQGSDGETTEKAHEHYPPGDDYAEGQIRDAAKLKLKQLEKSINEKPKKDDWHITKVVTRTLLLKLLYICHRMIETDSMCASTWKETYPKYAHVFEIKLDYQQVKEVVRNMCNRYVKEEKRFPGKRHEKYEKMFNEARDFYRKTTLCKNQMV